LNVVTPAVSLGLLAGVCCLAGCQADSPAAGCQLQQQIVIPASPLMLLRDARLDSVPVGGGERGFILLGADGARVRWATVSASGDVGVQHAVELPAHVIGPWFAVAGQKDPADTILVVYGQPPGSPGGGVELRVLVVPADGSTPRASVPLMTVEDPAVTPLRVAMGSSRRGMRAAFAWAEQGKPEVRTVVLGADGQMVAPAFSTSMGQEADCLSFSPGKSDLTLGFLSFTAPPDGSQPRNDSNPRFTFMEIKEDGGDEGSLILGLGSRDPTCPMLAPTDEGYALLWQNEVGLALGVYDAKTNRFFNHLTAGAVEFGGADLQPPVAGLGQVGTDYALILARATGGEVWRVGPTGKRVEAPLAFPSAQGLVGGFSSLPSGGSLYATYPDYTMTSAGVGTDGQRFLVKVGCF
jgi:hypothetical protein